MEWSHAPASSVVDAARDGLRVSATEVAKIDAAAFADDVTVGDLTRVFVRMGGSVGRGGGGGGGGDVGRLKDVSAVDNAENWTFRLVVGGTFDVFGAVWSSGAVLSASSSLSGSSSKAACISSNSISPSENCLYFIKNDVISSIWVLIA